MDSTIKAIRLLKYKKHVLTQIYSNFDKSVKHDYTSILENFNLVNPLSDNKSEKRLILIDNSGFDLYKIITEQRQQVRPPTQQQEEEFLQTPLLIDEYETNVSHFTSDYIDDEFYDDILEFEKMYADNNYNMELDLAISLSLSSIENESNKNAGNEEILETVISYEPMQSSDYILFDIDKCKEQQNFEYAEYSIRVKQETIDKILQIMSENSFSNFTELALNDKTK